ncbi:MAG: hypothetical protein WD176_02275, partial [Pirellulales bacterium]
MRLNFVAFDTVLVASTAYNDAGQTSDFTDAAGMVTHTDFDDAGRSVRAIQNYKPCGSRFLSTISDQCACPDSYDENVTIETSYTADGKVSTLTAKNPVTGDQTTRYVYGTTRAAGDLSTVARSDLLVGEVYPDAADAADQVVHRYNRQADRVAMRDQNGTEHGYEYDGLGRPKADNVTKLPASVDGATKRIELAHDIRGMISQIASRDAVTSGNLVNQVNFTYDNFRALTRDAQKHSASATTQNVDYDYQPVTSSVNTHRRTWIKYPNGRQLDLGYNPGADDDKLSRVQNLKIVGESTAAAEYAYFGLRGFAKVTYPEPATDIVSELATGGGSPSYPGFDRFNRVVDLPWTQSAAGDLAHLKYGYDRASNRVYRQDVKAGTANKFD